MKQDEAYLVGYTRGDGNLYSYEHVFSLDPAKRLKGYELTWGDKDIEQLSLVKEMIQERFPDVLFRIKERKSNKGKILRCRRRKVFQYTEKLMSKNLNKEPAKNIAAFISGFCDAEADVGRTLNRVYKSKRYYKPRIQITQKDKELLKNLKQILAKKFGIKSRIHKKWNQDVWILQISGLKQVKLFNSKINFRNPTKRSKLALLVQSSPNLVKACL